MKYSENFLERKVISNYSGVSFFEILDGTELYPWLNSISLILENFIVKLAP